MELFYTPPKNIDEHSFLITGSEAFHIFKVMRKKIGDEIFITDGLGWQYQARINAASKNQISGEIIDSVFAPREPGIKLTLAFGVLKGNHNDFVIEKGTEIGAVSFQPFYSKNSVTQKIGANKISRLERVALAAMKQSLRTVLPKITPPVAFLELVSMIKEFDQTFIADEAASDSPDLWIENGQKILLVVGPEGGFVKKEVWTVQQNGGGVISLGKTRLRSETAAIVASGLVLKPRMKP